MNNSEHLSEHVVQMFIAEKFHCYPLVAIPNQSVCALEVKGGNPWIEKTIWSSGECFYVPSNMQLLIIFPDVFDRDLSQETGKEATFSYIRDMGLPSHRTIFQRQSSNSGIVEAQPRRRWLKVDSSRNSKCSD